MRQAGAVEFLLQPHNLRRQLLPRIPQPPLRRLDARIRLSYQLPGSLLAQLRRYSLLRQRLHLRLVRPKLGTELGFKLLEVAAQTGDRLAAARQSGGNRAARTDRADRAGHRLRLQLALQKEDLLLEIGHILGWNAGRLAALAQALSGTALREARLGALLLRREADRRRLERHAQHVLRVVHGDRPAAGP
jgi:hypothetical protein